MERKQGIHCRVKSRKLKMGMMIMKMMAAMTMMTMKMRVKVVTRKLMTGVSRRGEKLKRKRQKRN